MTGRMAFTLVLLVKIISAGRAPARVTGDLGRLAWMEGSWSADSAGTRAEEHWTSPKGGVMLGMHRDVGGRVTSFEFLRIESDASGIRYLAQPQGRPATAFSVKAIGDRTVTF